MKFIEFLVLRRDLVIDTGITIDPSSKKIDEKDQVFVRDDKNSPREKRKKI
jgi:hypothetical protein